MGIPLLIHEALKKDLSELDSKYVKKGALFFNGLRIEAQGDKLKLTLLSDSTELATLDKDIRISDLQLGNTFTLIFHDGKMSIDVW